ncbi:hypothetical protein ABTK98_19400, partial [Acinetobacter baumannii]
AGSLTVAGDIVGLKSGAGGGQIQLNADGDLVIASGARLSTAGNGGSSDRDPSSISLNSSRGWLRLQGGSVQLDGGDLRLRAARNGQDVQID